jgi:hypothetical protein
LGKWASGGDLGRADTHSIPSSQGRLSAGGTKTRFNSFKQTFLEAHKCETIGGNSQKAEYANNHDCSIAFLAGCPHNPFTRLKYSPES